MFDKIISALPYNPSLIHQLSFYAKRIRKEEAVRKVGLVFIVLAFLIQFFAFISPPQSTSALSGSPNDLVSGGFTSNAIAATDCESKQSDYGAILKIYGISCQEVSTARTITLHSTDYNRDLWSMGRDKYPIAGDQPVTVGNETLWIRYLWGWDSPGTVSTYQALVTRSSTGQLMFLLYNCGNIVSVGKPVQVSPPKTPAPAPKPQPQPCSGVITSSEFNTCVTTSKKAIDLTQGDQDATKIKNANANDLIRYYLYATNKGSGVVKDYVFSDYLTYVLDYAHMAVLGTGKLNTAKQEIIYPVRNIGPHQTASVYFEVRVNSPIPQTLPPASDPNYYNMEMVNTYGKTIIIHLPLSPTQTIETITTGTTSTPAVLPNTGPGLGVFIAAAITAIAGFFFYRSRLLAKESAIAIRENSGGM